MIQQLGDIVEINIGRTPSRRNEKFWGSGQKWVSIRDLNYLQDEKFIVNTKESITELAINESKIKITPANTVLYSFKLSIGKIAITKEPIYTNEAIASMVIKDKTKLNTEYLFYALKKMDFQSKTDDAVMGKTLNKRKLALLTIPVPDLPTQNKIVALLDKASALVQKRENSIAVLDELLRAQFLDMFGDPVLNPKGWEMNKLSELCSLERGRFSPRPRNDPSYFGGEHPFIQTGDISNSNFRLSEYTQTLNEKGTAVSKEFKIGTIVIAIVGATIGKTAILEIDTYATDSIIGISPKKGLCNSYFIELVLRFYKEYLIDKAPSAARANINLKILNKLDFITPSLELQNKFDFFTRKTEAQKETLTQSKTELENLYNGLLQRAFNGQLNLNVDLELDALLAAIDVNEEENDIRDIATVYASRLLERLEKQEFENQTQYQQAKHVAFQLLKEGVVCQELDKDTTSVKMKLA